MGSGPECFGPGYLKEKCIRCIAAALHQHCAREGGRKGAVPMRPIAVRCNLCSSSSTSSCPPAGSLGTVKRGEADGGIMPMLTASSLSRQGGNSIDVFRPEIWVICINCSNGYNVGSKYWPKNWPRFLPKILKSIELPPWALSGISVDV